MKVSEEKVAEYKSKIRRILVRIPNATASQVAASIGIDRVYATKLMKKIHREHAERINRQVLDTEVGKMENEIEEMTTELWRIASESEQPKSVCCKSDFTVDAATGRYTCVKCTRACAIKSYGSHKNKISAMKGIIEAKKTLFQIKFDAGIFSRKLGELEVVPKNPYIKMDEASIVEEMEKKIESIKKLRNNDGEIKTAITTGDGKALPEGNGRPENAEQGVEQNKSKE